MPASEGSGEDLLSRLQCIDPYEFEDFVAEVWEAEGWETTVTEGQDQGVDVIAEQRGAIDQRLVIQVKRYSEGNPVTRPEVQQYYSMKEQDRAADAAVVVTTSRFTDGAKAWGYEHNVKLVDGEDLVDMIEQHGLVGRVDDYLGEPTAEPAAEPAADADHGDSYSVDYDPATTGGDEGSSPESVADARGFAMLAFFCGLGQVVGLLGLIGGASTLAVLGQNGAAWLFAITWFLAPAFVALDVLALDPDDGNTIIGALFFGFVAFILPVIGVFWYFSKLDT